MAVTKLHAAEEIRPLIECGCRLFGENRLAESLEKWPRLNREGVSLHLIGHLQSNKAKAAVEFFDAVDSLDSLSTLLKETRFPRRNGIFSSVGGGCRV